MPSSRHLWTLLAGAILVALESPSSARASCGHYVKVGGAKQSAMPRHDAPADAPAAPCTGPGCSQQRQPLTPTPAAPVPTFDDDRWGQGMRLLPENASDSTILHFDDALAQPIRHADPVYHPPR